MSFEALSPDDLKSIVLYVTAGDLKKSTVQNTLLIDNGLHAIVVIDECSLEDHDYFANLFCNRGTRLALITIANEEEPVPLPTIYYQLEPFQNSDIEKLLAQESRGLPNWVTTRLADLAEGYPSFALFLLRNYISISANGQDILNIRETLVRKLIAGGMDTKSDWFRITKDALMALALFEKVGFKDKLSLEAEFVAKLAGVSWNDFQKVVKEQKQRGIIRGEYYAWVTPFPLAVHLFREWWEIYGDHKDFTELINDMPQDMVDRFVSRFPFVTTLSGRRLIERLLSSEGIFADGAPLKTERGSNFFLKLTEADPQAALNCLKRTMGTWNKQELLEFKTGRRQIVWALEKIAVWKELFAVAARLLLALGEAENENYANNASGVFAGLFSPGWGPLSPTEVSLENRFPSLVEAIGSSSLEGKKIGFRAFETALQTHHISRMVGAEYQGSKPVPKLWTPTSGDEILNHYRRVWTYLEENLEKFPDEIKNDALKALLDSTRGLASTNLALSEMTRATIRKVSTFEWIDKSVLVKTVSDIVHYDGKRMPENSLRDWVTLRDDLIGSSFSDLLKRYVQIDLLEDHFQDGEKYDDAWIESKLRELAEKVMENPNLLNSEYSWLTTEKARRGFQFGYTLGSLDKNFTLLDKLIEQQVTADQSISPNFLGGYFRILFEKDTELWENKLDSLSEIKSFKRNIPILTFFSGMTDKAAKRILEMLQKGEIEIDSITIFKFGGVLRKMSEQAFINWASFILKEPSGQGISLLLDFIHSYYVFKPSKPLPKDITLEVLLHPELWDESKGAMRDTMKDYYWKEIAMALIKTYPETSDIIARHTLNSLGAEKSIFHGFPSEVTSEVLLEIVKNNPKGIWQELIHFLNSTKSKHEFYIMQWLRGELGFETSVGALNLFNIEDIWKWVDEKPEERATFLAHCVPPTLFCASDKICLARELLARYGNYKEVRDGLSSNYSTECYTGHASLHYAGKKKVLLEFKINEKNQNVLKWIDENLEYLDRNIERAKIHEEKYGY